VKPVRLQLSRKRGFNLQAHSIAVNGLPAVNVARPAVLGNPFIVGRDGSRKDCVRLFGALMAGLIRLGASPSFEEQQAVLEAVRRDQEALRGRNIACWCRPAASGEPDLCHGAVLLALLNNDQETLENILEACK
jgi:hypothetical protein